MQIIIIAHHFMSAFCILYWLFSFVFLLDTVKHLFKRFFILFANTATVCVEPWPRPETKGGIKRLWILRSYKEKKKNK